MPSFISNRTAKVISQQILNGLISRYFRRQINPYLSDPGVPEEPRYANRKLVLDVTSDLVCTMTPFILRCKMLGSASLVICSSRRGSFRRKPCVPRSIVQEEGRDRGWPRNELDKDTYGARHP